MIYIVIFIIIFIIFAIGWTNTPTKEDIRIYEKLRLLIEKDIKNNDYKFHIGKITDVRWFTVGSLECEFNKCDINLGKTIILAGQPAELLYKCLYDNYKNEKHNRSQKVKTKFLKTLLQKQ